MTDEALMSEGEAWMTDDEAWMTDDEAGMTTQAEVVSCPEGLRVLTSLLPVRGCGRLLFHRPRRPYIERSVHRPARVSRLRSPRSKMGIARAPIMRSMECRTPSETSVSPARRSA